MTAIKRNGLFYIFSRSLVLGLTLLCLDGCAAVNFSNYNKGIVAFKLNNFRDAFVRLKPEAEQGHPDAEYAVGYMYYYGQGVNEDHRWAGYWIRRAAAHGQPLAIAALPLMDKVRFCARCK